MAGKKHTKGNISIGQIEKALWRSNGLLTGAATLLGVTQSNITQRIQRSKHLQKVREDVVERMLDKAENVVHTKMVVENLTAAIFYLKCKGKHRGYIDKTQTELSTQDNKPLKFEVIFVDPIRSTDET